jgi:hypothetical protein
MVGDAGGCCSGECFVYVTRAIGFAGLLLLNSGWYARYCGVAGIEEKKGRRRIDRSKWQKKKTKGGSTR